MIILYDVGYNFSSISFKKTAHSGRSFFMCFFRRCVYAGSPLTVAPLSSIRRVTFPFEYMVKLVSSPVVAVYVRLSSRYLFSVFVKFAKSPGTKVRQSLLSARIRRMLL